MKFIFSAKDDSVSPKFFPIWKITLFMGGVVVLLVMLFPRHLARETRSLAMLGKNPVMAGYLQGFHAHAPDDFSLYMQLLEQDALLGRLTKVRTAIQSYKNTHPQRDAQTDQQFLWIEYVLMRFDTYQNTKPTTQQRIAYLERLRAMVKVLAKQRLSTQQFKIVAHDSIGLGLPLLALQIYETLFQQHRLTTDEDYAEAGALAMQNNKPLESADFYWRAYEAAKKLHLRRHYALNALAALWSGNAVQQSLVAARALPAVITNGQEQKLYLAKLAVAANRPDLALGYVLQALDPHAKHVRQFFVDLDTGKIVYQDKAFTMAYQVFIYNNHMAHAYRIAQYAVQYQPRSVRWRQKLAQSATWMGDYNVAMQNWLWVVQHTPDKAILLKAIQTTQALAYDAVLDRMLTSYLALYPMDDWAKIQSVQTLNRLGQPERALKMLATIKPSITSLKLQAHILADHGDWDAALQTWEKLDRQFGVSVEGSLVEADMLMSQGKYQQALARLQLAAGKAQTSEHVFWDTLADLAWIIHDDKWARLAYAHNLTRSENVSRLISLYRVHSPQQALYYSQLGWFRFHHKWFFIDSLSLAEELHQWPVTVHILQSLTPKKLQFVETMPIFWQAQASVYRAMGDQNAEKKVLIQGIERHPDMRSLKTQLLWLTIEQGNGQWIKRLLQDAYEQIDLLNSEGWHAYAAGLEALNHSSLALWLYLSKLGSAPQEIMQQFDVQSWIDLAGTLDKMHYDETAYAIRYALWKSLSDRVKGAGLSLEKIRAFCQVIPYFSSGSMQAQWINVLLQQTMTSQDLHIIWHSLVSRNAYELMYYLKSHYSFPMPDNIALFVALIQNDLPTIQAILSHTERVMPRPERIAAAERMENTALVMQHAFDALTEQPLSQDVYHTFTQVGIKESNALELMQEYEDFINLVGPRTQGGAQLRVTNSWKLHPYFSNWDVKTNNAQVLTNVPAIDLQTGMRLEQKIWHGTVYYTLGYRKALNSFVPADLEINFQPLGPLNVNVNMGFNQENFQTTYLRIGGVQDQLNTRVIYTPYKHDSLQTEIQLLNYYGQDRHYLADGYNLHALYAHKVWLTYPDYTFGVYGNLYYFNRNGSFGGDVTHLFPPLTPEQQASPALTATTQAQNYQALIPPTYGEGGVQLSFGDSVLEYSHAWRPYFWGAVYYNSITRLSQNVKGGLHGSVFGRDSLLAYAEYGNAPAVAGAVVYRFGLRYMLYW